MLKDGQLVGSWPVAEVTMRSLVRAMTGRELTAGEAPMPPAAAPVLLEVRGLSRRGAFEDVSLRVHAGEVVGVAGLVGSGRTELLRAIYGADRPDAGEVLVAGRPVRFRSPAQALRRGLGCLPEDRKSQGLLLNRALRENVSLASLRRFSRLGVLNLGREQTAVRDLISRLRIAARNSGQPAVTLSGGNQQKVVLARWLARHCRILLVDEPTRGVDVGAKEEIHRLLRGLASEGAAVLVVSSELKELFALCSRILVMRRGRLVGDFARERLSEAAVVEAMLLGGAGDGTVAAD